MPAGRPLKFKTPKDLENALAGYFKEREKNHSPLTVNGLAYHLHIDTDTLLNYEKRDNFSALIKRAKQYIADYWECRLATNSPTGAIFWLKNAGWKDRQEVEHSGDLPLTITVVQHGPGGSH